MELGMVGLGKMGANMTTRLLKGGQIVVVYDRNMPLIEAAEAEGAVGASALGEFAERMSPPRAVWVMVPAGEPTEETIANLGEVLSAGDMIIDGGKSACVQPDID